MYKLFRNFIVAFVFMVLVMMYSYIGGNASASLYKNSATGVEEPFYEFCAMVEELKYHVADYVSVEDGDPVEFLEKFRTPVDMKNDISHAIARSLGDGNVKYIFGEEFNIFVEYYRNSDVNYYFDVNYINECVYRFKTGKYNAVLAEMTY